MIVCSYCAGSGYVCENHPQLPWDGVVEDGCHCGGAGMPCLVCCAPVPQDGTHSIVEAFVPRELKK